MKSYLIYVVDDEKVVREGIAFALRKEYHVKTFSSAEEALDAIKDKVPDLVLLDIGLPGMNGIEALKKIKKLHPAVIVIMITAYEEIKTVVSAMKLGAYDYEVKPLQMGSLINNIRNTLQTLALKEEIQTLQEEYINENIPYFIGKSNAIQKVMEVVEKVAQSPDTSVMITGETGTGKELITKAIHYRSSNSKGQMVCVNCAAIPRDLIESELFGYEKGAFSGADPSGKRGLVEEAAGGTLFLDEVGDLSPEAQAKLLRFLEDGEYYRVGSTKKQSIRTRVISATNKDLIQMTEKGRFRKDLYYRLAVIKLEIPSLNERRDDIVPIARHFLVEFSKKFRKSFNGISPEAEMALRNYNWKGNVRELRNLIERGVLLGEDPVLSIDSLGIKKLSPSVRVTGGNGKGITLPPISPTGIDFPSIQQAVEKYYFKEALKVSKDNETRAAKLLRISRDMFRYRKQRLNGAMNPIDSVISPN
jgi:DNA-binding NtrC family response regulator